MTGNFTYTTVGYGDTTPTDWPCHEDIAYGTYDTSYCPIMYDLREEQKKLKAIRRRELLEELKACWNNIVIEKPIKPQRPKVQLRGVNFDGRGWA